jgi:hypothetical protein
MKKQQPKLAGSPGMDSERTCCIRADRQRPAHIRAADTEHERRSLNRLSKIGLDIVHEARAPVPLLSFGRRALARLQPGAESLPLPHFADALKRVSDKMHREHLHVLLPL